MKTLTTYPHFQTFKHSKIQTKQDLDEKFGKFGRVVSVWVARQPPGFAFVEFEDARDAEDAIRDMNNTEILG